MGGDAKPRLVLKPEVINSLTRRDFDLESKMLLNSPSSHNENSSNLAQSPAGP